MSASAWPRRLFRLVGAAGVGALLMLLPWPSFWPVAARGWSLALTAALMGVWGGPWAALGLALGQAIVLAITPLVWAWPALAIPGATVLATAARVLVAHWALAPGRADPRLLTAADWRHWTLGAALLGNLSGALIENSPALAWPTTPLWSTLLTCLQQAGAAALLTWLLGALLLRALSPLWRRTARRAPSPVDLARLLGVERSATTGQRR